MKRTDHCNIQGKRETTENTTKNVPLPVLQTFHNHLYLLFRLEAIVENSSGKVKTLLSQ